MFASLFISWLILPITILASDDSDADNAGVVSALDLIEQGDFEEAFEKFIILAKAGNAEAQHNLAMLYRAGTGVKKDLAKSAIWFQRAADQGISEAQYYLAYMYEHGEQLEQSLQSAFTWYRKAAEQGLGLAQVNLGVMYANGLTVKQDVEQAYLWFHAAAAQGYRAAFQNKLIIEDALAKEGWNQEKVDALKLRARTFFNQYQLTFSPVSFSKSSSP